MKYEKLTAYINNQEWENAVKELGNLQITQVDDTLAILAATICFQFGQIEDAYAYIREGLLYNYRNYELYFMLGNYYQSINSYQAWLCYENAEFYCDGKDDKELIRSCLAEIESEGIKPAQVSIVIVSYNVKDLCISCIESIRRNNPKSAYEIIVIDNASTDGIREWLQEQEDIILLCNEENMGFPIGCNQGIRASKAKNDVFLLHNDTILLPNSLFWLRMGLYEEEKIGATGSMTNFAYNGQMIEHKLSSSEDIVEYGISHNIPEKNALEKKIWLIGYAMLLKRKALDEIGLLDEQFSPGSFEDSDICVRLRYTGWKMCLCHNSFIFHGISGAGRNREKWDKLEKINIEKFRQKWGFNIRYYTNANMRIISLIKRDKNDDIRVLEIGCGGGATLCKIQYMYPNADVKGIELVEDVAKLGFNQIDIIQGNIETMLLPYEKQYFDYIIFGDVLEHLREPEEVLKKLKLYLRVDGQFICSIPNLMHESVIIPLLKGEFRYQQEGILDRTHLRFFTWDSICGMLHQCGLAPIETLHNVWKTNFVDEKNKLIQEGLYNLPYIAPREFFEVYQYVFSAGIVGE